MIFMSDEVTSESHWQIASQVTKKFIIHCNSCIIVYFLHAILCPWTHNSAINNHGLSILPLLLAMRSFLTYHCDVTTVDLWRQANMRYWNCDIIFVDCSCTCRSAQRRYSPMKNNVSIDFSSPVTWQIWDRRLGLITYTLQLVTQTPHNNCEGLPPGVP